MRQTCQCDGFTCRVISQFSEVSKLLRPVMLNMAMTLSAWIYVYEMKTDERLSAMFLMSGNSTTGNQYHDGIINAFSAMVVLAVVSFSMLLLALWDCRRLVQLWLHMSCLLILFAVSGGFFYDLLKSLEVDEDKIIYEYLPGLVTAYGGFGCIAFFYPGAPLLLHQFFVLSNCSLVSLFYLRSFPGYTAWFVLWCVALWDIFAVLAPIGPLRKVQEKAGDYSHDVLRFLMFTADAKPASLNTRHPELEKESSSESESDEEEFADSGHQSTTGSSFTVTSDESEGEADAPPEQPLLRRRVRQAAGADTMEMFEDALSEEKKIKEEQRKAERMKKEKNSDLSSDDDEIAVELEEELSAHTPDTTSDYLKNTPWEKEYPIDDKEALSMEHHRKNLESSSSDDDGSSSSDDDESYSSDEDSERSVEIEGASVTAADALNDANSLRLGMGDFVFYSVLVGQAATTGNIGATIAAALGVVYGLLITLTYFSNGDETTPALPISIVLGTIFHFSFLFLEPYALYYTDWMFHYLLG